MATSLRVYHWLCCGDAGGIRWGCRCESGVLKSPQHSVELWRQEGGMWWTAPGIWASPHWGKAGPTGGGVSSTQRLYPEIDKFSGLALGLVIVQLWASWEQDFSLCSLVLYLCTTLPVCMCLLYPFNKDTHIYVCFYFWNNSRQAFLLNVSWFKGIF